MTTAIHLLTLKTHGLLDIDDIEAPNRQESELLSLGLSLEEGRFQKGLGMKGVTIDDLMDTDEDDVDMEGLDWTGPLAGAPEMVEVKEEQGENERADDEEEGRNDDDDEFTFNSNDINDNNNTNGWFPYKNKTIFLLNMLDNLPHLHLLDDHMKAILWLLKEVGALGVPSFYMLRKQQEELREAFKMTEEHA